MKIYEVKTEQGCGWYVIATDVADASMQASEDWKAEGDPVVSVTFVRNVTLRSQDEG